MPTFEKNRFLGIAFLVLGLLKIVSFLIVLSGIASFFHIDQKIFLLKSISYITIYSLSLGVLLIIGGIGFLNKAQWAKMLGLMASVIALFDYPLGTLIGICGIWFLTSKEFEEFYAEPEKMDHLDLTVSKD